MDAEQLAQARENYFEGLPDTAELWTTKGISDGAGGRTNKPRKLAEGFRCRVAPLRRPVTSDEGGRVIVRADWRVQLAHPTIVPEEILLSPGDEIRVTAQSGKTFSLRVHQPQQEASQRVCLTVECKKAE